MLSYINNNTGAQYVCVSTDEKQTDVPNGSILFEMDTGEFYLFNKETLTWELQAISGGGGGGGEGTVLHNRLTEASRSLPNQHPIKSITGLQDELDKKVNTPVAAGSAGQVLTNDGAGGTEWADSKGSETAVLYTPMEPKLTAEQQLQAKANIGAGDFVTPQMFGAVGDGIADDSDAIQEAIDKGYTEKRAVYLPTGVYKITKPIVIENQVTLIGPEDMSATIMTKVDLRCFILDTNKNEANRELYIANIRFDGNFNRVNGIEFNKALIMYSTLKNLRFEKFTGSSIYLVSGEDRNTYAHEIDWQRIYSWNNTTIIAQENEGSATPWFYGGKFDDINYEGFHRGDDGYPYIADLTGFYDVRIDTVVIEGYVETIKNAVFYANRSIQFGSVYNETIPRNGGGVSYDFVFNAESEYDMLQFQHKTGWNNSPFKINGVANFHQVDTNLIVTKDCTPTITIDMWNFGANSYNPENIYNIIDSRIKCPLYVGGYFNFQITSDDPIIRFTPENAQHFIDKYGLFFNVRAGERELVTYEDPIYGKCWKISNKSKNLSYAEVKINPWLAFPWLNAPVTFAVTAKYLSTPAEKYKLKNRDDFSTSHYNYVFDDNVKKKDEYFTVICNNTTKDESINYYFDGKTQDTPDEDCEKQEIVICELCVFMGHNYGNCISKNMNVKYN